jgi:hypothetical protein
MIWMDVDTAIASAPVNAMPLVDDTDFKTIEAAVTYNQAGLALFWNFTTTGGVTTCTAVTPTTGGTYDWTDQGTSGLYAIEIPASGGASINNDTEGFGWFTGMATGVLPWAGPIIGFRAAALNNSLVDAGATGLLAPATAARTLVVDANGLADANMVKAGPTGAGTAQTARDLGASVLLSSGTGAGQISLSSGEVTPTTASKTGYALTATTGLGNQTANITGNLSGTVGSVTGAVGSVTGAVGSVTGAVGSVTGAVGSVTGAVGSVTGNVGGNVAGSVGSVTGLTAADVGAIKTITDALTAAAAAKLALSALGIIPGTVDTAGGAPTSTVFEASDITEATADHYVGRIVTFTSGAMLGQSSDITAYALVGGRGHFTVTALTEAPANAVTFVVT